MKKKHIILFRVCKFGLLLLFIGYYGCITLFYHSHLVNGHIITHSHPYKHSSPFEKHSHSGKAYLLIDQLNKINCEEASLTSPLPKIILVCFEKIETPYLLSSSFLLCRIAKIRGPPSFSI
jgi:hypothetical protein